MIQRGQIRWLDHGAGSLPAERRPVVVVQADALNKSAWRTCLVVSLTTNTSRAASPDHVYLPAGATGLAKNSVAVASHLNVVTQEQLLHEEPIGVLPAYLLADVEVALRAALDL